MVIDCVINDFINELVGCDIPQRRKENIALYQKYERRHKRQNFVVNHWDNFTRKARKAAHLSLNNPAELWRLATRRKPSQKSDVESKDK